MFKNSQLFRTKHAFKNQTSLDITLLAYHLIQNEPELLETYPILETIYNVLLHLDHHNKINHFSAVIKMTRMTLNQGDSMIPVYEVVKELYEKNDLTELEVRNFFLCMLSIIGPDTTLTTEESRLMHLTLSIPFIESNDLNLVWNNEVLLFLKF